MQIKSSKAFTTLMLILISAFVMSCQSSPPKESSPIVIDTPSTNVIACSEPRRQMCTKEYRPVCAKRNTDTRCVTTPCPSTEWVTKSNACSACADTKVLSYMLGACQ